MLAALLSSLALPSVPLDITVESRNGLRLSALGLPLIRGSWFQYYEPGWTKGYYSSNWNDQQIERTSPTHWRVTFSSGDKRATGSIDYRLNGTDLTADYTFRWSGPERVNVELCAGMLWSPAWDRGELASPKKVRDLMPDAPSASTSREARTYVSKSNSLSLSSPFGTLQVSSGHGGWDLFDGRNLDQDWSRGRDLWWLGDSEISIPPGGEWKGSVRFSLDVAERPMAEPTVAKIATTPKAAALTPPTTRLPIIPKPKEENLSATTFVRLRSIDDSIRAHAEPLRQSLNRHWEVTLPESRSGQIRAEKLAGAKGPGHYELDIRNTEIVIRGADREGFLNGMRTLAWIAMPRNGTLHVPVGTVRDWPSNGWRGVHLFVGPQALRFQTKLWNDVLGPMKFNQMVLQCERTDWVSQPKIKSDWTMSRSDLKSLFAMYRAGGAEPTPLIQSFGHMGWLFMNGQNRDIAFNPDLPFSIDPRKPRSRDVLSAIWDEAAALLKPKTFHFGLDEVALRGFPNNPKLVTELWSMHVPFLSEIAKKYDAKMMIWGDKGLAPGEAIDAMHGDNPAEAKARRDVIPDGAYIADWHYRNDPNPEPFRRSLQLWKREGQKPIASTWFRTDNVRGFTLAANMEGAGVLQTTWAGYESNEPAMMRELQQFTAMILAADYAWSNRQEQVSQLPYRPADVFRRLYFAPTQPLRSARGQALTVGQAGPEVRVGTAAFRTFGPIVLDSVLAPPGSGVARATLNLPSGARGSELAVLLESGFRADEGEAMADLVVHTSAGRQTKTLVYGWHARAKNDSRDAAYAERSADGRWAFRFSIPKGEVRSIELNPRSRFTGLKLHAATLMDRR